MTERPTPLPLRADAIPDELRDRRQFVVWSYTWAEGKQKWDKPPRRLDGRNASVTNPADWCSFAEAVKALGGGRFDGIGFVLTDDDPYVALDLDHVVDHATRTIAPWAARIVDELQSYTEVSPSGTGLRIFVRGMISFDGRRRTRDDGSGLEIYASGRYVTITGHRYGAP